MQTQNHEAQVAIKVAFKQFLHNVIRAQRENGLAPSTQKGYTDNTCNEHSVEMRNV